MNRLITIKLLVLFLVIFAISCAGPVGGSSDLAEGYQNPELQANFNAGNNDDGSGGDATGLGSDSQQQEQLGSSSGSGSGHTVTIPQQGGTQIGDAIIGHDTLTVGSMPAAGTFLAGGLSPPQTAQFVTTLFDLDSLAADSSAAHWQPIRIEADEPDEEGPICEGGWAAINVNTGAVSLGTNIDDKGDVILTLEQEEGAGNPLRYTAIQLLVTCDGGELEPLAQMKTDGDNFLVLPTDDSGAPISATLELEAFKGISFNEENKSFDIAVEELAPTESTRR
jgi:hypothetical protein